jgi:hypothetical protein
VYIELNWLEKAREISIPKKMAGSLAGSRFVLLKKAENRQ